MLYFSQLAELAKNLVAKLLDVLIASILYKFRKYSLPLIEERPENKDLSQGMFFLRVTPFLSLLFAVLFSTIGM